MRIVLITGARDWNNPGVIRREIQKLIDKYGVDGFILVAGKAPGADQEAAVVAENLNVHMAEVKALWNTRHRAAGPQRNRAMLALGPDEVIGFHKQISKSRGTKDCIKQAKALAIPTRVVKK